MTAPTDHPADGPTDHLADGPSTHPLDALRAELAERDARAVVAVGRPHEPTVRYLRRVATSGNPADPSAERVDAPSDRRTDPTRPAPVAVAVTADDTVVVEGDGDDHPALGLVDVLDGPGPLLAPVDVPYDAALYVAREDVSLASTDAVDRARAHKTPTERDRIERAQAAAAAGLRAAAATLAAADPTADGLAVGGDPLTAETLRRAADRAVVDAGAMPAGNTTVTVGTDGRETIHPGDPVVCALAPRGPAGYHGGLARTLVPESDGGWERRAHVALTQAFRSAATMLSASVGVDTDGSADEDADAPEAGAARSTPTVAAVEAELEAEARSFGFAEEVRATVHGVGLEPIEGPVDPGREVEPGAVCRLEASVESADGVVTLADLLAVGGAENGNDKSESGTPTGARTDVRWLARPSQSLHPTVVAHR